MTVDLSAFKETLIVLTTAAVVIPLFKRMKVSPAIGFILVGVLVGPYALGRLATVAPWLGSVVITEREAIEPVAELGIALLMFMIGLELSFERIIRLRRLVFGLGSIQVLGSALVIGVAALLLTGDRAVAFVLGFGLALSSTAVVVQTLSDTKHLSRPPGRLAFAVLLFQDLAVVPILFMVDMLGQRGDAPVWLAVATSFLPGAIAVGLLVGLGRLALRPLFRLVAGAESPESFMAAILLVILGASFATAAAGLSMAMGALIAGLLLAETEYRRQIEVLAEPFKGILLGVFLISVGMSIDVARIVASPLLYLSAGLALVAVKAAITASAARLYGASWATGIQAGLLLGPGSEFTFVIVGAALAVDVLSPDVGTFALSVAAITMATIPILEGLGQKLVRQLPKPEKPEVETLPAFEDSGEQRVLICGFGRVGRTVADMLEAHNTPYMAIDSDAACVTQVRAIGKAIAYGDATNIELLRKCGVANARALVVTMDDPNRVAAVVAAARAERDDLIIVCRARDAEHAGRLYRLGATDAVPETTEASLVLCEQLLVDLGVPMGYVIASIHERRALQREEIQSMAPDATVRRSPLRRGGRSV